MSPAQADLTIRKRCLADPFRTFLVHTTGGREVGRIAVTDILPPRRPGAKVEGNGA
jgi:hypothetical protein